MQEAPCPASAALAAGGDFRVRLAAVPQDVAKHAADAGGVGGVIDIAAFAARRDKARLFELRKMEGKAGGRDGKLAGQIALRQTLRAVADQQAQKIEPRFMGHGRQGCEDSTLLHLSTTRESLN